MSRRDSALLPARCFGISSPSFSQQLDEWCCLEGSIDRSVVFLFSLVFLREKNRNGSSLPPGCVIDKTFPLCVGSFARFRDTLGL